MKTKSFLYALTSLLFVALMSTMLGSAFSTDPYTGQTDTVAARHLVPGIFVSLIVLSLFLRPQKGVAMMAVTVEIWLNYVIENLFKGNEFILRSFKESDDVLNGVLVHIPQAGAKRRVVKNRTQLPANIVQRSDSDIMYALDEYTTDPILIRNAETVELSYDKVASILSEDMEALREAMADDLIYKWRADASGIIRTTGGATAGVDGQTGNRKIFTKDELKKARKMLNKQNISKENRIALLDSEFLDQLQSDLDLIKRDAGRELDMKNGVIDRLYGFDIIERSGVLMYDNTGTPVAKLPGAEAAADDNIGALIYQQNCVAHATGEIKMFENQGDATLYGDVYSFLCRMGGRKRRADNNGVISIVQATAA